MTVEFADADPEGIVAMVGGLIRQNLERDPSRLLLLRPAVATIRATDADVAVTIRLSPGSVVVSGGEAPGHLCIQGTSLRLLELIAVPLRFGLPDALSREGRAAIRDVLARRIRIRGMVAHPRRLARITTLVSVR